MGLIYYALDDHKNYLFFARKSLESLRRQNGRITVKVFVYCRNGRPRRGRRAALQALSRLGAEVIIRRIAPVSKPTMLKFVPLMELEAERVLFADADTLFFEDPRTLFDRYARCDVYARREMGTCEGAGICLVGTTPVFQGLSHLRLRRIARELRANELPVFNTGLIVFNHGSHRRLAASGKRLNNLAKRFLNGSLAYPCANPQILDEICLSLTLGGIKGLTCGRIRPEDVPFYIEWRAGLVKRRGVVMHTFSNNFLYALADVYGTAALAGSPDWQAPLIRTEVLVC